MYEKTMDNKELILTKLTITIVQGERNLMWIVELEENKPKLEQKALIECTVQSALAENTQEQKLAEDRCEQKLERIKKKSVALSCEFLVSLFSFFH